MCYQIIRGVWARERENLVIYSKHFHFHHVLVPHALTAGPWWLVTSFAAVRSVVVSTGDSWLLEWSLSSLALIRTMTLDTVSARHPLLLLTPRRSRHICRVSAAPRWITGTFLSSSVAGRTPHYITAGSLLFFFFSIFPSPEIMSSVSVSPLLSDELYSCSVNNLGLCAVA